jgi:hypothetical protein
VSVSGHDEAWSRNNARVDIMGAGVARLGPVGFDGAEIVDLDHANMIGGIPGRAADVSACASGSA